MMLAEDLGLPNLRSITVADIQAVHCPKPSQRCSSAAEQSIYRSHVPNEGTNQPDAYICWFVTSFCCHLHICYAICLGWSACFPTLFAHIYIYYC